MAVDLADRTGSRSNLLLSINHRRLEFAACRNRTRPDQSRARRDNAFRRKPVRAANRMAGDDRPQPGFNRRRGSHSGLDCNSLRWAVFARRNLLPVVRDYFLVSAFGRREKRKLVRLRRGQPGHDRTFLFDVIAVARPFGVRVALAAAQTARPTSVAFFPSCPATPSLPDLFFWRSDQGTRCGLVEWHQS